VVNGDTARPNGAGGWCFLALAVASVVFKIFIASQGNNYDVESFALVADTVLDGRVVYAETARHNYGPVWAYVAAAVRLFQEATFGVRALGLFHILTAALLAYVDVLIALLLRRRYGAGAAAWFLANPVSLLITGYHSQFDNLAVLAGLAGALLLTEDSAPGDRRFYCGTLLLGVSLTIKHIMVFFPLWLLFRRAPGRARKLAAVLIPWALFGAGFVPFMGDAAARAGIVDNVFRYEMTSMPGFYPRLVGLLVPARVFDALLGWVPVMSGFKSVWLATLLGAGWVFRRVEARRAPLLYLAALCVFSSNLADQYLAIPLAACAVWRRSPLAWLYALSATLYLLASPDNIGCQPPFDAWLPALARCGVSYWLPYAFLFALLAVEAVRSPRRAPCRNTG